MKNYLFLFFGLLLSCTNTVPHKLAIGLPEQSLASFPVFFGLDLQKINPQTNYIREFKSVTEIADALVKQKIDAAVLPLPAILSCPEKTLRIIMPLVRQSGGITAFYTHASLAALDKRDLVCERGTAESILVRDLLEKKGLNMAIKEVKSKKKVLSYLRGKKTAAGILDEPALSTPLYLYKEIYDFYDAYPQYPAYYFVVSKTAARNKEKLLAETVAGLREACKILNDDPALTMSGAANLYNLNRSIIGNSLRKTYFVTNTLAGDSLVEDIMLRYYHKQREQYFGSR